MRFKDFTEEELDIMENSLYEYGYGKKLITEIRNERERRKDRENNNDIRRKNN